MYAARILGAYPDAPQTPEPAVNHRVRYNTAFGTITRILGPWNDAAAMVLWDDGERDTYEFGRLEHVDGNLWELED